MGLLLVALQLFICINELLDFFFVFFFFDCLFWVHLSEACVDMIKNVVAVVTYV